jgi:WD40 repeat protein
MTSIHIAGTCRDTPASGGPGGSRSQASLRVRSGSLLGRLAAIMMIAASINGCASLGSGAHATGTPISTKSRAPTGLRLNPKADGLFCATQVSWSPDSTRIALVGNAANCSGAGPGRTPGLLTIYSVATGKVIQKLLPDTTVLALPAISQQVAANSAAGGVISTLSYQSLTWTPDGQALLMIFDLELLPSPNACCTSIYGMLRLGATDPSLSTVWLDTTAARSAPLERWNLTSGTSDIPTAPAHAAAYQWNADGTLAPVYSPAQSIGAPDGGQSFTVWQPGVLLFGTKSDKSAQAATVIPHDAAWISTTSPVSPDGHYYFPNMTNFGSLVPPSTQSAGVGEPVLQPHDQALVALAQQMMSTPSPSQNITVIIGWRPDGSYLAAYLPNAVSPSPTDYTTSIYDTASGKLVRRVAPDFTGLGPSSGGGEGTNIPPLWSPDGSHLLVSEGLYGSITIWKTSSLLG